MGKNASQLNAEGRQLWNKKAEFWDSLHGEHGNQFHRELIGPAVEHLLGSVSGKKVIDIACGSGQLARRLASLGARVTAVDFSDSLLALAEARGQAAGEKIDYRVVDATDEAALAALGEGQYDAVVSTMAMMDMPVLGPLFRGAFRLLKAKGCFVFATAHPAFNSNNPIFFAEREDQNGQLVAKHGLKILDYLDVPPMKGSGAVGEPSAHYYYHRPLSALLGEAFQVGFVLDALEEPSFQKPAEPVQPLTWDILPQIPPVVAGRFCKR